MSPPAVARQRGEPRVSLELNFGARDYQATGLLAGAVLSGLSIVVTGLVLAFGGRRR